MMTGYGVRAFMLVANRQSALLKTTNFIAAITAVVVVVSSPLEDYLARRRYRKRQLRQAARARMTSNTAKGADSDGGMALLPTVVGGSGAAGDNGDDGGGAESLAAATAVVYADRWPTRATLIALAGDSRRREWVDAIRRAKEFRFQCEMCPKGLEPVSSLEAFMRHVRAIWVEAKTEDSALEPALGAALERLALVHARLAYRVQNEGGGLTSALEEALLDPSVIAGVRRRKRAQVRATNASVLCTGRRRGGARCWFGLWRDDTLNLTCR